MSISTTKEMCLYCFEVLESALHNEKMPSIPPWIPDDKSLIFVTWRSGQHEDPEENSLRGCKGSLGKPYPLGHMLQKFALNSAFEDTRFDPIQKSEFSDLLCEVSILHSFEEIDDHLDWVVGTHGISIDYQIYDKKIFNSGAIFLPTVAPRFGWDTKETIKQLVRKGGYRGHVDFNKIKIKAVRHQTSINYATHEEYISYKGLKDTLLTSYSNGV